MHSKSETYHLLTGANVAMLSLSALQHMKINVPYLLENTPPFFAHYCEPKVGRGFIFEYALSIDNTPTQGINYVRDTQNVATNKVKLTEEQSLL